MSYLARPTSDSWGMFLLIKSIEKVCIPLPLVLPSPTPNLSPASTSKSGIWISAVMTFIPLLYFVTSWASVGSAPVGNHAMTNFEFVKIYTFLFQWYWLLPSTLKMNLRTSTLFLGSSPSMRSSYATVAVYSVTSPVGWSSKANLLFSKHNLWTNLVLFLMALLTCS